MSNTEEHYCNGCGYTVEEMYYDFGEDLCDDCVRDNREEESREKEQAQVQAQQQEEYNHTGLFHNDSSEIQSRCKKCGLFYCDEDYNFKTETCYYCQIGSKKREGSQHTYTESPRYTSQPKKRRNEKKHPFLYGCVFVILVISVYLLITH